MVAAEDACERGWERQLRAGECLGEGGAGFEDSPQIWVDVPLRIVQTYELVCDFGDFLLSCDTKLLSESSAPEGLRRLRFVRQRCLRLLRWRCLRRLPWRRLIRRGLGRRRSDDLLLGNLVLKWTLRLRGLRLMTLRPRSLRRLRLRHLMRLLSVRRLLPTRRLLPMRRLRHLRRLRRMRRLRLMGRLRTRHLKRLRLRRCR